jgi:hypothetical protein
MINENLMNPIPLHTSKNKWYCKRKTNHGAYVIPLAPVGRLLPMALTIDNTMSLTRTVGIVVNALGIMQGSYNAGGDMMSIMPVEYISESDRQNILRINAGEHGKYRLEWIKSGVVYTLKYAGCSDIEHGLLCQENIICDLYNDSGTSVGTIKWTDALLSAEITLTATIYPCGSNEQTGTSVSSYTGCIERVPYNAATTSRWANIVIPAKTLLDMSAGMYYMKMTFDNADYYSEPFEWYRTNDNRNIISVSYRRTSPIVTSKNCISFSYGSQSLSMEMYLPTYETKPPYKFDSEVDELDGWKFVNKQVSYLQQRCEFLCTQYFAEAIRLLWHCNERRVAGVNVDYMEPPEIDWSDDNHVCDVTLLFQCDTIVQTNGETAEQVSTSDGTSFNGSFNPSFG